MDDCASRIGDSICASKAKHTIKHLKHGWMQVMFDGECLCDGPVETWLNSVVDAMKQALFAEYQKALPAYDMMKRSTEWIYEFSAQNTIVVSRTFFTQEVNEAFEELEEGNEDALKVCTMHSSLRGNDDMVASSHKCSLHYWLCPCP
jgi:hypothetical protein